MLLMKCFSSHAGLLKFLCCLAILNFEKFARNSTPYESNSKFCGIWLLIFKLILIKYSNKNPPQNNLQFYVSTTVVDRELRILIWCQSLQCYQSDSLGDLLLHLNAIVTPKTVRCSWPVKHLSSALKSIPRCWNVTVKRVSFRRGGFLWPYPGDKTEKGQCQRRRQKDLWQLLP